MLVCKLPIALPGVFETRRTSPITIVGRLPGGWPPAPSMAHLPSSSWSGTPVTGLRPPRSDSRLQTPGWWRLPIIDIALGFSRPQRRCGSKLSVLSFRSIAVTSRSHRRSGTLNAHVSRSCDLRSRQSRPSVFVDSMLDVRGALTRAELDDSEFGESMPAERVFRNDGFNRLATRAHGHDDSAVARNLSAGDEEVAGRIVLVEKTNVPGHMRVDLGEIGFVDQLDHEHSVQLAITLCVLRLPADSGSPYDLWPMFPSVRWMFRNHATLRANCLIIDG